MSTGVANTLTFRLLEESDLDAVCDLESRAYEFPWSNAIIGGVQPSPIGFGLVFKRINPFISARHFCQSRLTKRTF